MTSSPILSVFDFDPEEIARQLTIIDFSLFAKIKPAELLNQVQRPLVSSNTSFLFPHVCASNVINPRIFSHTDSHQAHILSHINLFCSCYHQAWQKPKYRHRAHNILRLVERMNNLTLWVATTILSQRVCLLEYMFNLSSHTPVNIYCTCVTVATIDGYFVIVGCH